MSEELKRMRQRHGTYTQMTSQESLPNEFLIVDSGDEATQDGKALYYVTSSNERKRLVTADEGVPADSVDTDQLVDGAVTEGKLAANAVTTAKIKNGAVTGAKIATGTIETTNIGIGQVQTANIDGGAVTGDKIDGRTITGDKLALKSVDTTELADLSVTYAKLAPDTTNYIDGHLPYARIVQNVGGIVAAVDITYLNSLTFNSKTFYYVWFAVNALFDGSPREWCVFLQLKSDCQIAIRPNGDIYYREYSNAQWSDFKIKAQDDYSNNAADYSLGFDSNGVIKTWANVTGLTTFLSGCDSVYTAPKCTTLTSQFKSVNPDLTDIYVDNYSKDMMIDSSITSDTDITIHYRGTFKLIDLLTASQLALANRVGQADTKIDKPTKCIYFDEDGCVYTLTSGIHTGGARVGITSVYAPSSITEIPDRALVSTPDLTTIYIDNASSAVTLGTDIQAAVNNNELTIYYKGQFNLANILATSQKKLNLRLLSLEATVRTLNSNINSQLNLNEGA